MVKNRKVKQMISVEDEFISLLDKEIKQAHNVRPLSSELLERMLKIKKAAEKAKQKGKRTC